jgi:hypothetical protein
VFFAKETTKASKPRDSCPVSIGHTTDAYSALADTDVAYLSPKHIDEELDPDNLVSHALSPEDEEWDTNLSYDTDDEKS